MWNTIDYVTFFSSFFFGFLTSLSCPIDKSSGNTVKFRPPSWVFAVVWSILYLLIGLAWTWNKQCLWYFIFLNICLNLWIIVYSCMEEKKGAIWFIILSILATGLLLVKMTTAKYLLVPLITWLIVALLLNVLEVQELK